MSRKGATAVRESGQIPVDTRAGVATPSAGGAWTTVDVAAPLEHAGTNETRLLTASPELDKGQSIHKIAKRILIPGGDPLDSNGSWKRERDGKGPIEEAGREAVERVADIEKWLKTRTESVSSMDLETMKSVVEDGVERYLGEEELPHAFLGKDPDTLSIDIDLSDKKLNLSYDPILQDLQSEKLLDACEKDDEFMLPEFHLDHLDPLALSPDDMMVAGEILPSTSGQGSLNVAGDDGGIKPDGRTGVVAKEETCNACSKSIDSLQVAVNRHGIDSIKREPKNEGDPTETAKSLYVEALTDDLGNSSNLMDKTVPENNIIEQLKLKAKMKLEPRIIKKRRKISERFHKKEQSGNRGRLGDAQDGVMAVVAISTDKISNTTQIVINTGTEEQIYQGKTSELIEATGNFPKLPRIDTSAAWNGTMECSVDSTPSSQHEIVISNALEELGITDESFQPVSISEHGKVWLCPREDCSRQFNRLYVLKGHLLAHYGIRPFKCDFEGCTWAFYSEFKLKRHKETHLKRKDYVCEVEGCNRRFTTIYNLWSHEKLHSRPNRIVCSVPDCQEKFQTKRALEFHMKSHDQSHAPYVCKHEGCGKRYYSSNALTSHQRCHSYKEIDVKCSWPGCGKVFDKPCRLKAHIRSHTGCKPYPCTFQGCQWAFSSSSKLKRHQKKHTNERKFVCDVPSCGKAFMRSEHLREHRLTHNEGRYFQCYICDARFSAKSSLYVHIKKHQAKENADSNPGDASGYQKRVRSKESQCSRVNPVTKLKKKAMESTEALHQPPFVSQQEQTVDTNLSEENSEQQRVKEQISQQDQTKTSYQCPLETCARFYTTKSTLRAHMLKVHGVTIAENDSSHEQSDDPILDMNYVLYTAPPLTPSNSSEQMIMATSCDAIILSTSPETDRCAPEPEPPPLSSVLKDTETSERDETQERSSDLFGRKDQGSARTCLTFSDVWRLKANGVDSIVGTSDVVLGTGDVGEGLLLTDELPSMYYQDEVVGTEYQVLLLDSGPVENAINLRGLE